MSALNAMRQLLNVQCWRFDATHQRRRTEQLQHDIRAQEVRVMQIYHTAESAQEEAKARPDAHRLRGQDGFDLALHALHLAHNKTREQQQRTAHLRVCHKPGPRDAAPKGWPMLSFEQLRSVRKNASDARHDVAVRFTEKGRDLDRKLRLDPEARDVFLRAFDEQEVVMPSRLGIRNYPWARELALATLL